MISSLEILYCTKTIRRTRIISELTEDKHFGFAQTQNGRLLRSSERKSNKTFDSALNEQSAEPLFMRAVRAEESRGALYMVLYIGRINHYYAG